MIGEIPFSRVQGLLFAAMFAQWCQWSANAINLQNARRAPDLYSTVITSTSATKSASAQTRLSRYHNNILGDSML
jgi:hypothetical protein